MALPRILVTGASGLLGHAVARYLARHAEVVPLGHQSSREGLRRGDLTRASVLAELAEEPWSAIVHCAAFRSPDYCEAHPADVRRLNTEVPIELARIARRKGARLVHVSTDYVFEGTHPPYHETDPCCPVNEYGRTKRAAEVGIAAVNPEAVVMRIGALFGVPVPGIPSPMLEEALSLIGAGQAAGVDHHIKRYPLWVEDVARAVEFFLAHDVRGVVHVGSSRGVTRYEWTLAVAALLGRSAGHLHPADRDLTRPATRPVDVGLAMDRLREWGGPVPPDFEGPLATVLGRMEKKLSDPNPA